MTTSQTVTATIEFPFTDEDIEMHIFGSGFGTWDWWQEFYNEEDGYTIEAENPNADGFIRRFVSYDKIRSVVGDILSGRVQCSLARQQLAYGNVQEMDLDADGADQIMQIVVFGEVVFG
jgi:hypothetical protein